MSDSCRACRTPIPPGGHAANGHACVLIQMAALKAQIVADAAAARAADAFVASGHGLEALKSAVAARREALAPDKTASQKEGA